MTDEELTRIKSQVTYTRMDTLALLAEVERLRTELAALQPLAEAAVAYASNRPRTRWREVQERINAVLDASVDFTMAREAAQAAGATAETR